jgi:hypothetical protein
MTSAGEAQLFIALRNFTGRQNKISNYLFRLANKDYLAALVNCCWHPS